MEGRFPTGRETGRRLHREIGETERVVPLIIVEFKNRTNFSAGARSFRLVETKGVLEGVGDGKLNENASKLMELRASKRYCYEHE